MDRKAHSNVVYVLAVACSTLTLGIILVALLRWQIPRSQGFLLPLGGSFFLSSMFGFFRQTNPWFLGLWASSAFWIYFGGVFVSLALHADLDWLPFLEGAAALGLGVLGALTGRKLDRVMRKTANRGL